MELTLEMAKEMMEQSYGNLCLYGVNVTSLPDNLTVKRNLYLDAAEITNLPDNLTVEGDLFADSSGLTCLPKSLKVGGSLYLSYSRIISLPDDLTVCGNLDLSYTPIAHLPKGLTVECSMFINGTKITSLPDDLIVGRSLDISETPITSLPNGLVVGFDLCLYDVGITSVPETVKLGGALRMDGKKLNCQKLKNGDYEPGRYLYADGILTHVRRTKKVGDYTFYVGKIPGRNVISDGTHYSHCETLREGIADLLFKTAKDRGADQYRSLTPDSEVKTGDAIVMYRIITGACLQGTRTFVQSLGELKDFYTVREIAKMTEGQYGSKTFSRFFSI